MRFLSIYKCAERNTPPSQEEMARMGKMIEEWMRSGNCSRPKAACRVRLARGFAWTEANTRSRTGRSPSQRKWLAGLRFSMRLPRRPRSLTRRNFWRWSAPASANCASFTMRTAHSPRTGSRSRTLCRRVEGLGAEGGRSPAWVWLGVLWFRNEKQILRLPPPGLRKRLGPRALRMTAAFGVSCARMEAALGARCAQDDSCGFQEQILRLPSPRLKKTPGAPCAQDDICGVCGLGMTMRLDEWGWN